MATTFKIKEGDIVINDSTGRPKLIGNPVGEDELSAAQDKVGQDLKGGLSTDRLRSGASASISELRGVVPGFGIGSMSVLMTRQIRDMFSSFIRLQNKRITARPRSERFSRIVGLLIRPETTDRVSFRFKLDAKTVDGRTIVQSGQVTFPDA